MDQRQIKEKITKGWIRANLIIEVLGKPAEHIVSALNLAIDQLQKTNKGEIISKKVNEPKTVEKSQDIFTTFAEVDIIVPNLSSLIEIIFDYMPSSVEITEPMNMPMKIEDANAMMNDLAMRLHQYDTVVKRMRLEFSFLAQKLNELEKGKKVSEDKEDEKKIEDMFSDEKKKEE
jgi:hypothetical protein